MAVVPALQVITTRSRDTTAPHSNRGRGAGCAQDAGDVFQWKVMFQKYDADGSGALSGDEVTMIWSAQ
jgi:hypothetical protein